MLLGSVFSAFVYYKFIGGNDSVYDFSFFYFDYSEIVLMGGGVLVILIGAVVVYIGDKINKVR